MDSKRKYLALLILTALAIFFLNFLTYSLFHDFMWISFPFHSTLKALGAGIALLLAVIINVYKSYDFAEEKYPVYIFTSAALVSMGVFDLFHACAMPGDKFVYFHSLSMFTGGAFFAAILVPPRFLSIKALARLPQFVFFMISLFCMATLIIPIKAPLMLHDGEFTIIAEVINITGGGMFLVASLRFHFNYFRDKEPDYLLFSYFCLFSGLAGIFFRQSHMWHLDWWYWHSLRFASYVIILLLVFNSYQILEKVEEVNAFMKKHISELERVNNELNSFTGVVSHDLKNPIANIMGMSELLVDKHSDELDNDAKYYIKRIRHNAKHMNELIDGLLEISRIGRTKEEMERIDVNSLVMQIINENQIEIERNKIQMEFDGNLPQVDFPRVRLYQVFSNLIKNAIKFRRDDIVHVIKIGAAESFGEYIFHVSDNGIGIEEKNFDRIFEIFSRIGEKKVQGTGIGLAIVKKVVEENSGRIWLTSGKNKGTTFYVALKKSAAQ